MPVSDALEPYPRLAAPTRGQAYETVMPVEVREWIRPAPASPDLVLEAQPPAQPHRCVVVERPKRGRPARQKILPRAREAGACGPEALIEVERAKGGSGNRHSIEIRRLDWQRGARRR